MLRRVLVIEDKAESANYLKRIIASVDSSVVTDIADTRERALVKAFDNTYDVICADVILNPEDPQDISGIEVVRELRKTDRYRFAPIIMITSLEDPKLLSYSELHCYSYIEKPFDIGEVKRVIKSALRYKNEKDKSDKYLFKKDGVIYSMNLDDVIYIEITGKKTRVHTVNDEFDIPYTPVSKLLKGINNSDFAQCNRACIVNMNYVEMVDSVNRYLRLRMVPKEIELGSLIGKRFIGVLQCSKDCIL